MMDLKVKDEIMDSIFEVLAKYRLTHNDIDIIAYGIMKRADGSYFLEIKNPKKNTSEK